MSCAIVGDSIAVDLHAEAMRGCQVNAKIGIGSAAIIARVPGARTDTLIISAGSNDPNNPALRRNLDAIRSKAVAERVIWILPIHPRARAIVIAVAAAHGDHTAGFQPSRDNVHPRNNAALARAVGAAQ